MAIRESDVPSDDASVAALTLSGVDIGPFSSEETDYAGEVATEIASTTVAIADGSGSTAGDTRTVSLAEGDNAITTTGT